MYVSKYTYGFHTVYHRICIPIMRWAHKDIYTICIGHGINMTVDESVRDVAMLKDHIGIVEKLPFRSALPLDFNHVFWQCWASTFESKSREKEKTTGQEHAYGASDGYNMCFYGRWWRSVVVNLCIHADATQKNTLHKHSFCRIHRKFAHSFSYAFQMFLKKNKNKNRHTHTHKQSTTY